MNVIYIRSYPSECQDHALATPSSAADDEDKTRRREWKVSIRVNDGAPTTSHIQDPFIEADYKAVFEDYLQSSDRPRERAQGLGPDVGLDSGADNLDEISLAEDRIRAYGRALFDQLEQQATIFSPGLGNDANDPEAQIYVVEHYDNNQKNKVAGGIHCLAWELLESVQISHLPKLRLRVTRVSDFPSRRGLRSPPIVQRLAAIQADSSATFKILLVIARDFSRTGAERDPEPDLAQWPLMNLQKKLRSRLTLEIVRPGSLEELEHHLNLRSEQKVTFNLIHLDLHGRIMRDEAGVMVPWLLFARKHVPAEMDFSIPQTRLAKAEDVAEVLSRFRIENVVLNACLSAYNRSSSATNLAHLFLRYGISNVSAMWFYVHWKTVTTYVHAFYDNLLVNGLDFHIAAQRAREALRQQPTILAGRVYQDFFLCVNYARNAHRTDSMLREISHSPLIQSHDSVASSSNNSAKSHRIGILIKSPPRIGESLIMGDEPIMRLQLHLLELEFKLMTFKIVYASDLHQTNSDLNCTMDKMVNMWLNTNLIDEVHYYKAKDFGRRRFLSDSASIPPREKRTRTSNGGPLQRWFPRPIRPIRQTLHIVREVDSVIDPGFQTDELDNLRHEERRFSAKERLQAFARKLHADDDSYLIFLGSQNAQWWRTYLKHMNGQWWLDKPWSFTVHARHVREVRAPKARNGRPPISRGMT
ncbi:hypothetical protein E4U24_003251 [Claviceps purpurea]|nr:hypothetical protein E4U24_003251 [Claviceps purpurea]KAG6281206.1 hypothetical protein E4U47_000069 [Claviceps purpurea]